MEDLPQISGRAIALMGEIARARYHYTEEGLAFALTHLDGGALSFVKAHNGGVASALGAAADHDIMGRFLTYGGTPEQRAAMSNEMMWQFAQGLLRDTEPQFASRPGFVDEELTKGVVRHLREELEKCGYEYVHGDLVPRGALLPAEAEQRSLFDDLLDATTLPHADLVRRYFGGAEKDLHAGDLKGVGHNVRLATDLILEDVIAIVRERRTDTQEPGKGWTEMVDYLQALGALGRVERVRQDTAEAAFLKGYYRFISVEGSHTGIPERHDAESVLRLGYFVAAHLLEKFIDWRSRDFADYAPS